MARTLQDKLAILSDAAKYDASCASSGGEKRDSRAGGIGSSDASVRKFAPEKRPETIRAAMAQVRLEGEAAKEKTLTGKRPPRFAPAGQSTQMIIGADGTDDVTILQSSTRLYTGYKLRRVYYSAFSPIPDASSALPLVQPPLLREHRLYQADWLLHFHPNFDGADPP